jgi:hypothetical protein
MFSNTAGRISTSPYTFPAFKCKTVAWASHPITDRRKSQLHNKLLHHNEPLEWYCVYVDYLRHSGPKDCHVPGITTCFGIVVRSADCPGNCCVASSQVSCISSRYGLPTRTAMGWAPNAYMEFYSRCPCEGLERGVETAKSVIVVVKHMMDFQQDTVCYAIRGVI